MPVIEFGKGRSVEECQPMQVGQRIWKVVFLAVDLAHPIHR